MNQRPQLNVALTGTGMTFTIDLETFSDFLQDGYPLRLNIYGKNFAWVPHEAYPSRLSYGDTNTNCAGWLVL